LPSSSHSQVRLWVCVLRQLLAAPSEIRFWFPASKSAWLVHAPC